MWSRIKTLDKLRSRAAAAPSGTIKVSIHELNQIKGEIEERIEVARKVISWQKNTQTGYRNGGKNEA